MTWEVALPESFQHEEDAKLAVMLPEWDVRRGRTTLKYSEADPFIEVFAGKTLTFAGKIQTSIQIDGKDSAPAGDWHFVCDFSDDDVHFIEIEQCWTGGIKLQRHLLLVRDDRCLMFADAVLPEPQHFNGNRPQEIKYLSRLPMTCEMVAEYEPETTELFLADGKRRVMVLPLAANEWKQGKTPSHLSVSEDDHLVHQMEGVGSLYAPLWFDFCRRRFRRKRTWRMLTVADERRICSSSEAAGFRIQVGSEQWLVYRSLGPRRCRTILGKHLAESFSVVRFDMSDGSYEELITVDDD